MRLVPSGIYKRLSYIMVFIGRLFIGRLFIGRILGGFVKKILGSRKIKK